MIPFRHLATVLLAAGLAAAASGQTDPPPSEPTPTPPETKDGRRMRRLLREGTFLDSARGRLHRDETSGWWSLRLESAGATWKERNYPYEIILLPNRRLEDMERIVTAAGDDESPRFEVSGEVFVYGSRNFLLAQHAPRLVPSVVEPEIEPETEPEPAPATETDPPTESEDAGDSIEDIMRDLVEAVGPLQQRATAEPGRAEGRPIPEGTVLVSRRGRLDRTADGAWMFIFDADASGMADPPLVVMPCLMLQRIEQYARRAGRTAPLVLSGRVFQYRGQSYVLPTLFRIPRERTALAP